MGIGHPTDFTNDELLRWECISAQGLEVHGFQIKERDSHSGIRGANLGVADVQVLAVDGCNGRVVHEVLHGESTHTSLVEAQETEETSIGGEP